MLSGKFHGRDQPDDPERLAEGDVDPAGDGNRLAVVLVDRAGVEMEHLGHHPDLPASARDRLAGVGRFEAGEGFGVLLDEAREPAEQATTVGWSHGAPGRECGRRTRDSGVGFLDTGLLELGDRLLGGGVEHGERHRGDSTPLHGATRPPQHLRLPRTTAARYSPEEKGAAYGRLDACVSSLQMITG